MENMAKTVVIAVILCGALCGCGRDRAISEAPKPQPGAEARYGKELEEIRKSLRGDIRIKLRRDGKGTCSWEITGKDPQDVVRADALLTKRINAGKPE
ncbi:MAG: hypothetical protein A4E60_00852 [Syntrophorhabdus sp. PtaB.Bin047]|jgi:hypothetical protein|nr:MAG: hypothetical protein A4E60_00852 [Syntrophorhabdus sp. PtaB.Bin047]